MHKVKGKEHKKRKNHANRAITCSILKCTGHTQIQNLTDKSNMCCFILKSLSSKMQIEYIFLKPYLIAVRCVLVWSSSDSSGIKLRCEICTAAQPIWNITINDAK